MVNERTLNCLRESELDTIEIALRHRVEDLISSGDIGAAEVIEGVVKSLDGINVCAGSDETQSSRMKWLRGLAGEKEFPGAIGGRHFTETYGGEESRY